LKAVRSATCPHAVHRTQAAPHPDPNRSPAMKQQAMQSRIRSSQDQPDARVREHADARVKIKSRAQPDSTIRRREPEPVNDRVTLKDIKTGPELPESDADSEPEKSAGNASRPDEPAGNVTRPDESTGNPTRPLDHPPARRKARQEQDTLQDDGPNALPVSDFPLKRRPPAANPADRKP
jgi:hypothetical protein